MEKKDTQSESKSDLELRLEALENKLNKHLNWEIRKKQWARCNLNAGLTLFKGFI